MADYTEDSFAITPMGVVKGLAPLRGCFEQVVKEFGGPGALLTLQQRVIEGDVVYLTWSAETSANTYSFGTDTFVIRNGTIVGQTTAAVITPKS